MRSSAARAHRRRLSTLGPRPHRTCVGLLPTKPLFTELPRRRMFSETRRCEARATNFSKKNAKKVAIIVHLHHVLAGQACNSFTRQENAGCEAYTGRLWPAGAFSSGQGGVITVADATEFSPMGALDIAGLQDGFRGELLCPQDSGYEDARKVWNGSITRFTALIATHTGLSGLALGGGINWLQRKYGLTIDQLLSVDLITAEGEFVKASASENPD